MVAYVFTPEGKPARIDESELKEAVERFGFRVRQPAPLELERAEAADSPVTAALAAGTRSALPVVGEKIVEAVSSGTPEESRRFQKLLAEENPVATGVGSAAGYMALAAGPGKLLAPLRAASMGGRVGAALIESGGIGLNEASNEAIIGDKPLTAELVAAHMGPAMLGGVLGEAVGTSVAKGVGKLGEGLTKGARALGKGAENLSDRLRAALPLPEGPIGDLIFEKGKGMAMGALGVKGLAAGVVGKGAMAALKSDAAQNLVRGYQAMIQRRLDSGAAFLGPFQQALEAGAAQGGAHLLETHMNLANSPMGLEYRSVMGIEPDTTEGAEAAMHRLQVISHIQAVADAQAKQTTAAVDGLFKTQPGRKTSLTSSLNAKGFLNKMTEIESVLRDPESVYASLPPELTGAAPEVMGMAVATLVRRAQYLKDRAPQSPYANLPASVAPQWEPSAADLDKFNRVREAVEEPAKVLRNMAQGLISPDQVEAMKAVYPAMYEDLRLKISERLMQASKPLTYQQRLGVMAIVGPKALGMSAQQAQILQQSFAPGQPQPQGGMKGPDGRQTVNQEKNLATQAQRLEGR